MRTRDFLGATPPRGGVIFVGPAVSGNHHAMGGALRLHKETRMLSYVTVGTNDLGRSESFFTQLFAEQGVTKLFDHPRGGVLFGKDGRIVLGVLTPFDRGQAVPGNGAMIALDMPTREAVDAFHAKALALGGSDEGAPGERGPGFYMSYFRDPEGNKFCACRLG